MPEALGDDTKTATEAKAAPTEPKVTITFDADKTINLALQQNRIPSINLLQIENLSEEPLESVEIRISAGAGFGGPLSLHVDTIKAKGTHTWRNLNFDLDLSFLAELREMLVSYYEIAVFADEREIFSDRFEVEVLSVDHWNGLRSKHELIAAFIQPNTSAVEQLLVDAAERLSAKGMSLCGYQADTRKEVIDQVESIFQAIQARGILYSNPPASFEEEGQKVRLPQHILDYGLATCLDTTLLFCACAEQAGLNTLVVVLHGHAFSAVWLEKETFPESAFDIHSRLKNRVDLHAILPVETTLLCQARATFGEAVEAGRQHLSDESRFVGTIDIKRCRQMGIRPLPFLDDGKVDEEAVRMRQERASAVQQEGREVEVEDELGLDYEANASAAPKEKGEERMERWKRNLLDLTLNNRLLNFRSTMKTLSLATHKLAALEDQLAAGVSFSILPSSKATAEDGRRIDISGLSDGEKSELEADFDHRILRAGVTEKMLPRKLTEIYRAARLSIEESGSNTLYLALGFLRWRRGDRDDVVREAPLVLMPLTIKRKSVKEGYRLMHREEETMFNTSLLELLRTEFGLEIPGLDPLPEAGSGLDLARIFRLVRHAIANLNGWTVVEAAEIGLFSFAKFLMWKDLESYAEALEQNPLVAHLMRNDGSAPDFVDAESLVHAEEIDSRFRASQVYAPLSADSSQMAAIFSAVSGQTIVLEGPPGTGKSQTITNLIVHALGKGQTVLFVAEKQVALQVVYRRLAQVGLADFALELHSNYSNKAHILRQLAQAIKAKADMNEAAWNKVADDLEARRKELNDYVQALHRTRTLGVSIWEGLNRAIPLRSDWQTSTKAPDIKLVEADSYEAWRGMMEELRFTWGLVGDPKTHALADCRIATVSRAWERDTAEALDTLHAAVAEVETVIGELSKVIDLRPEEMDAVRCGKLHGVLEWLAQAPAPLPEQLLTEKDASARLRTVAQATSERDQAVARCTEQWYETSDAENHVEWSRQVREAELGGFFSRFFAKRRVLKSLQSRLKAGRNLKWTEIAPSLEAARQASEAKEKLESMSADRKALIADLGLGMETPEALCHLAEQAQVGAERLAAYAQEPGSERLVAHFRALLAQDSDDLQRRAISDLSKKLAASLQKVTHACDPVTQALGMTRPLWDAQAQGEGALGEASRPSLPELKQNIRHISSQLSQAREWKSWVTAREKIREVPWLNDWLERATEMGCPSHAIVDAFDGAFFEQWVDEEVDSESCLSEFLRQRHEDRITQFHRLDEEYRFLANQVVRARIASKIPELYAPSRATNDSETGILIRELQKRARHMPVRKLLEQIPNLLRLLKPCLLMSPLSVAQYLSANREPFDLIIFDEASQITPWDSLGALARGRTAVIVGDPKQLPPTAFFQRGTEGEEWEENIDMESILDECLASRIPTMSLGWHYRSRHESLITFSNVQYYGNQLLTFPSAARDQAVHHIHVPDGTYDKGRTRTNQKEAERVVEEIVTRLQDPERQSQSLGVVTFSSTQQSLIEELLDKERAAKPELEPWFSDAVCEPVFVKNLESVQGDERDVILFSIGYGPDKDGNVSMNFGPLNRQGGQRRLNVAITRAREEVLVVSTLLPEDIDLSRTSAPGVSDLRYFLEYARRGTSALSTAAIQGGNSNFGSPLEQQVAHRLEEKGYQVQTHVGCSGYRIDLGVAHPDHPDAYLIGIEFDGASYSAAANARDRDNLRQAVLEGLGWSLMRVWSTDWWRDPEAEFQRILDRIEEAKQNFVLERVPTHTNELPSKEDGEEGDTTGSDGESKGVEETAQSEGEDAEEKDSKLSLLGPWDVPILTGKPDYPVYRAHRFTDPMRPSELFYAGAEKQNVYSAMKRVFDAEAPISDSLLAARVRAQWGLKSTGRRILEYVRTLTRYLNAVEKREGETIFYWPPGRNPDQCTTFRVAGKDVIDQRRIEDVPLEEIAAAAHEVLTVQVSLDKEGLVSETARILGYKRVGTKVNQRIQKGIDLLLDRGIANQG